MEAEPQERQTMEAEQGGAQNPAEESSEEIQTMTHVHGGQRYPVACLYWSRLYRSPLPEEFP